MTVLIGFGKTLRKVKKMNRVYRGWFISKDPIIKGQMKAVKGRESIIGTIEEIVKEIDQRAIKETKK